MPTTMLYRNFLAIETEELLRSHPIDGAVLMAFSSPTRHISDGTVANLGWTRHSCHDMQSGAQVIGG